MVKIIKIDYTNIILKTIAAIFGAIAIYWLILKIIGRSPDLSKINLILIVMLITATLNFYYRFGKFEGKIEEFISNSKDSFSRIKEDIKEIKRENFINH